MIRFILVIALKVRTLALKSEIAGTSPLFVAILAGIAQILDKDSTSVLKIGLGSYLGV